MAFIKVQKLARDKAGNVTQGTASIVDTAYVADGKYHSKQSVREPLGKVLSLSDDRRSGVFLSQRRGLVHYDAEHDTFRMLSAAEKAPLGLSGCKAQASLVFGDAYWYLQYLLQSGLMEVLKEAFPDEAVRQLLLARLLHKSLPSGHCTSWVGFLSSSFAGLLFPVLDKTGLTDENNFFSHLGNEIYPRQFFSALHGYLQGPESCVLVKTSPLPWQDSFCPDTSCLGTGTGCLCMAFAKDSGLPVWFSFSANEDDVDKVFATAQKTLGKMQVRVETCILNADAVTKDFIREFCSDKKDFIALMPARKDFQYKDAFKEYVRPHLGKAKFEFSLEGKGYFGRQIPFSLFGRNIYVTNYVDMDKAWHAFKEYSSLYPNEVLDLGSFKREWMASRFGYFALASSAPLPEKKLLDTYLEQSRRYSRFASLCPGQRPEARRGAILFACIQSCIDQGIRKTVAAKNSTPEKLFAAVQPLFCLPTDTNMCLTETPSDKARECFAILGIQVPACIEPEKLRQALGV